MFSVPLALMRSFILYRSPAWGVLQLLLRSGSLGQNPGQFSNLRMRRPTGLDTLQDTVTRGSKNCLRAISRSLAMLDRRVTSAADALRGRQCRDVMWRMRADNAQFKADGLSLGMHGPDCLYAPAIYLAETETLHSRSGQIANVRFDR